MKYRVFYMIPEAFRDFCIGVKTPTLDALSRTHVFLREIEAESLEAVFAAMQAENWSPNGEARPLIEQKGLAHTSMSVGDIVQDAEGVYHYVAPVGFKELK